MKTSSIHGYNCSTFESLNGLIPFIQFNCTNTTDVLLLAFPQSLRTLQAVLYMFELIIGVSLSVFLIYLILFRKSLRQRGFAVALQILLTNIAFTIPVLSTGVQSALEDGWMPSYNLCMFIAFCNQSFQPQRWLLTTVLVTDRALTVTRPLKYEKHRKKTIAILSIVAIGLGLLIGIIPPSVLPNCNGYIPGLNTCHFVTQSQTQQSCGLYGFMYVTLLLLLGGVLPFCLYIWMFWKAKKATIQIVPEQTQTNTEIPRSNSVSRKQLMTIFLLFWTLLGCLLPHYIAFVCVYISDIINSPRGILLSGFTMLFTQPLYYGLVIADPIALMWHKDVKQELRKLKNNLKKMFNIAYLQSTPIWPSPS